MLDTPLAMVQQVGGILLILLILLDVFLTVLYARMGTGIVSRRAGRFVWRCFRVIARAQPKHGDRNLSFCGPVILAVLVFTWMSRLSLGHAFVLHSMLGQSVQLTGGKTPTDVVSALHAGGSSLSIVGSSDFTVGWSATIRWRRSDTPAI